MLSGYMQVSGFLLLFFEFLLYLFIKKEEKLCLRSFFSKNLIKQN